MFRSYDSENDQLQETVWLIVYPYFELQIIIGFLHLLTKTSFSYLLYSPFRLHSDETPRV